MLFIILMRFTGASLMVQNLCKALQTQVKKSFLGHRPNRFGGRQKAKA